MEQGYVKPIGTIHVQGGNVFIELEEAYREGLEGLAGFSHINVFWWFSEFDNEGPGRFSLDTNPITRISSNGVCRPQKYSIPRFFSVTTFSHSLRFSGV